VNSPVTGIMKARFLVTIVILGVMSAYGGKRIIVSWSVNNLYADSSGNPAPTISCAASRRL